VPLDDPLDAYRLLIADVYELAGQSRRTSEVLAHELEQTAARWHLLSVVSDGPRTVAGAARPLGLTRQSVQRVVDDLVAAGQVQLGANPDHTRSPLVALTDRGRATLVELVQRSDGDRRALLDQSQLTADELNQARAVLTRLLAALRDQPS
jgi:DNA-binding MarR family transcriptional regulator